MPELTEEQLVLTEEQLVKIGFNKRGECFELRFPNGRFFYNPDQSRYRWYQEVVVGSGACLFHLDIRKKADLFTLLQIFRIKFQIVIKDLSPQPQTKPTLTEEQKRRLDQADLYELDELDEHKVLSYNKIKQHLAQELATQREELAGEVQRLRIVIKQIIGMNAVYLLPSQTERCEGFYKGGLYKAIGINVTKDLQEALLQKGQDD